MVIGDGADLDKILNYVLRISRILKYDGYNAERVIFGCVLPGPFFETEPER